MLSTLLTSCALYRSRGALSNELRVVICRADFAYKTMIYHKIFSLGCAPHPLSLKTRFSLYHIKVLHLFANRLDRQATRVSPARGQNRCCKGAAIAGVLTEDIVR